MIAEVRFIKSVLFGIECLNGGNVTAVGVSVFNNEGVLEGGFVLDSSAVGHIDLTGEAGDKSVTDFDALNGKIGRFGLLLGYVIKKISYVHHASVLDVIHKTVEIIIWVA